MLGEHSLARRRRLVSIERDRSGCCDRRHRPGRARARGDSPRSARPSRPARSRAAASWAAGRVRRGSQLDRAAGRGHGLVRPPQLQVACRPGPVRSSQRGIAAQALVKRSQRLARTAQRCAAPSPGRNGPGDIVGCCSLRRVGSGRRPRRAGPATDRRTPAHSAAVGGRRAVCERPASKNRFASRDFSCARAGGNPAPIATRAARDSARGFGEMRRRAVQVALSLQHDGQVVMRRPSRRRARSPA